MNGRGLAAVLATTLIVAACGSGGPGGTGGPGPTGGPGATGPGGNGGGGGNGTPTEAPGGGSGATVRLVNVWAESDKLGPTVSLRLRSDPGVVLLSAAPGTVTEFVEVPKASFGDGPAAVEAIPEGGEDAIGTGNLAPGDRLTVIVHGEVPSGGGAPIMRVEPIWEKGEPYFGQPWPTGDPGAGVITVVTGPLLALPREHHTVSVRTADGACLFDPVFNQLEDGGFGGTGGNYLLLEEQGPVEIDVSTRTVSGCVEIDPDIGTAEIDTSNGTRFAIIVWGMLDELELLTLDMGTG